MIRSSAGGTSGTRVERGGGRVAVDGDEELGRAPPAEGARTGEHLVQEHAQRENVAPRVDGQPLRLLRRHVRRSADDSPFHGRRLVQRAHEIRRLLGDTEVEHLRRRRCRDHHVLGLQIAVDDPRDVSGRERVDNFDRDAHARRDGARGRQPRAERLPADELHRDIGAMPVFADLIDGGHVRVRNPGGRARLSEKPPLGLRVRSVGQHLDGDRPPELLVVRLVHDPHPAGAELRAKLEVRDARAHERSGARGRCARHPPEEGRDLDVRVGRLGRVAHRTGSGRARTRLSGRMGRTLARLSGRWESDAKCVPVATLAPVAARSVPAAMEPLTRASGNTVTVRPAPDEPG